MPYYNVLFNVFVPIRSIHITIVFLGILILSAAVVALFNKKSRKVIYISLLGMCIVYSTYMFVAAKNYEKLSEESISKYYNWNRTNDNIIKSCKLGDGITDVIVDFDDDVTEQSIESISEIKILAIPDGCLAQGSIYKTDAELKKTDNKNKYYIDAKKALDPIFYEQLIQYMDNYSLYLVVDNREINLITTVSKQNFFNNLLCYQGNNWKFFRYIDIRQLWIYINVLLVALLVLIFSERRIKPMQLQ
jgi:hypothetical protein